MGPALFFYPFESIGIPGSLNRQSFHMGSLIGSIVVLIVLCIIVRALRARYAWIDGVFYALLVLAVIATWISSGFWAAVGVTIAGLIIVGLLLGLSHEEKIHINGKSYTFECEECGYNRLDILHYDEHCATTKCKRCGHLHSYILR